MSCQIKLIDLRQFDNVHEALFGPRDNPRR